VICRGDSRDNKRRERDENQETVSKPPDRLHRSLLRWAWISYGLETEPVSGPGPFTGAISSTSHTPRAASQAVVRASGSYTISITPNAIVLSAG
jgi:hypothetical protein